MFDRLESWLKGACILLGALILLGVVRATLQSNPLARVVVPSPPTLPADTNSTTVAKGTNQPGASVAHGTNVTSSTNAVLTTGKASTATNHVASKMGTNQIAGSQTNPATVVTVVETNKPQSTNESAEAPTSPSSAGKTGMTNSMAVSGAGVSPALSTLTNSAGSNGPTSIPPTAEKAQTNAVAETGVPPALPLTTTNAASNVVATSTAGSKTNGPSSPTPHGRKGKPGMPPDMAMMMGMGGPGPKLPELPPIISARIDKITDSEILAPVMHPQPMALLGIAGNVAFLRSPSGQTGLLKESETLGELKLLRIGTNRVLIEQDGQKKELTIFSGYGGESLMPKSDKPHEPNK